MLCCRLAADAIPHRIAIRLSLIGIKEVYVLIFVKRNDGVEHVSARRFADAECEEVGHTTSGVEEIAGEDEGEPFACALILDRGLESGESRDGVDGEGFGESIDGEREWVGGIVIGVGCAS